MNKLIEILFANRNKDYGAYELRKNYDRNVLAGLGVSILILIIILASLFFDAWLKQSKASNIKSVTVDLMGYGEIHSLENMGKKPLKNKNPDAEKPFINPVITSDSLVKEISKPEIKKSEHATDSSNTADQGIGMGEGAGTGTGSQSAEEMPTFPTGDAGLFKFIRYNVQYPDSARRNKIKGTVLVQFTVTVKGELINITIVQGVHPLLDREAMRVIKSMPNWIPGRQGGMPVEVTQVLPIVFRL